MIRSFLVLVALVWGPASAQQRSLTIDGSNDDFMQGYLQWLKKHPEALPGNKRLVLEMPSLDLYSPSGVSIYYGTNPVKNGAFLESLPQGIHEGATTAARPSLKEALDMFPALKAQEDSLLSDHRYTVFAVADSNCNRCKAQNDAMARLRTRARQSKIRVLEVRLHQ